MQAYLQQMRRLIGQDLRLAVRQGSDAAAAVVFFVLVSVLFPFGVGPEANLLARMAPGILWAAALLAALLSLERMFGPDYEDGSLEQYWIAPMPLELVILSKATAHWLITGLPLIAVTPVVAILLNHPPAGFGTMMLALLLGTPCLSLIGCLGAALTLGARRSGLLIPLLILPLDLPVLIFGAGAVDAASQGLPDRPHLLMLAAILALALPLVPLAGAAALRQALE